MKKIFFLVNSFLKLDLSNLIEKQLPEISVSVGTSMPMQLDEFDLLVLWNYRKKINVLNGQRKIVLFHSSALPNGRGFAPIYNTIANGLAHYVISGIFVAPEIDEGEIIVQASFSIRPEYMGADLRRWDSEISFMLIRILLDRSEKGTLRSRKQVGAPSWWPRRKPEENEIDVKLPFEKIIGHLRACEENHPAFFTFEGVRYFVSIRPEKAAMFPRDLQIVFPNDESM